MALAIPEVLGTGYGWVQAAMGERILTIPLWILLILPFAKILATSLSIGSGGSGGIFGPGMVIGGFLGAAIWRLTMDLPAVPHSPMPFVVIGMIACFGSIAHAPLAVMLMVGEMTGSLEMLAPAMVAVGIASAVVGRHTIYESQLKNRTEAPAHRFRFGLPLLASLPVADAMREPRLVLHEEITARDAHERLSALAISGAPVVDGEDVFRGSVETDRVAEAEADVRVRTVTDGSMPAVPVEATLDAVVEIFATEHVTWVPVLDLNRRVVGIVGTADLIQAYRQSLASSLRSLRSIFSGSVFIEATVHPDSAVQGQTVGDADWPRGAVVIAIQRGDQLIFPEPKTEIRADDALSVLVPRNREERLRAALGEPAPRELETADPPML
jgi:CBS domain-containing protein